MAKGTRRILVSAGDSSGDLILSKVIEALRREAGDQKLEFVGLCGPACVAQGVKALASSKDVAVVGIFEVLKKLKTIFGALDLLRDELSRVDSLICVDFPDFNLKLAGMAQKKNIPVDYIVAPQVWAWRSNRLPKMRRLIRRLYPALPFEENVFREAGLEARYLGHPIRDLLPPRARRPAREKLGVGPDDFIFCLMPGSRKSEIQRTMPILVEAWKSLQAIRAARTLPAYPSRWRAAVPVAPGWSAEQLIEALAPKEQQQVRDYVASGEWIFHGDSHEVQMAADFGWITSGTATLEAAYYQLPHILFYRLSGLTAFLIQSLSSYFTHNKGMAGLPNILLGRPVIPELLQKDLQPRRLATETFELLADRTQFNLLKKQLRFVPQRMGDAGATERIAQDLWRLWTSS